MQSISSFDIDGNERLLFSFKEINECPACHFGIEPRILYSSYILSDSIGIDRSCFTLTSTAPSAMKFSWENSKEYWRGGIIREKYI